VFALEEPGHPSANVDLFDRLSISGELQVINDRLLERLRDGHLGRGRFDISILLLTGDKQPRGAKDYKK
jgi:hypothetical protein